MKKIFLTAAATGLLLFTSCNDETIDIVDNSNPTTNKTIKVEAGTNSTVSLPTNTFNLSSTITNPNGDVISSIIWSKVSGGSVTFSNAENKDTKIANLQNGDYVFKVTVTNDKAETFDDTVTISVDNSKVLYGFTFEDNDEGFTNVGDATNFDDRFGHTRGQKSDFKPYESGTDKYAFYNNDTYFIGNNLGHVGGVYSITDKTIKKFTLNKSYGVNELGLQFSYQIIDPWHNSEVKLIIKSEAGAEIAVFSEALAGTNEWKISNSDINKALPAGNYTLSVEHHTAMTAVDDIYLFEK
ncbi:hypothetical protein Q4553_09250 [Tenacibaculum soleae]|uniref:PKD domain-containing protein n=1 Tax=Tenacibaculum soleae TaxID=447689 RepID=UPI0026E40924|nr:hypothetical protein [Tenacibaculum soleae]MDO6744760.1 hypothetical protein [Tenacibaculum soleae]